MNYRQIVKDKNDTSYIVRNLETEDSNLFWSFFQSLSAESKHTFQPHPWTKYFAKKICDEHHVKSRGTRVVLTDISGKKILGYGFVNKIPLFPGTGYLGIGIADKYQGVGLGYTMIKSLLFFARKDDFGEVLLNVYIQNGAATRLYEKVGFRKFKENFVIQKIISLNELIFNESLVSALLGMIRNKGERKVAPVVWMRKKLGY